MQTGNTATWVDERYGALLAKQANRKLSHSGLEVDGSKSDIKQARAKLNVIASEPWEYGFGVKKVGTCLTTLHAVHHASVGFNQSGLQLDWHYFDHKGRHITHTDGRRPVLIAFILTLHAVTRLFQRLRSNDINDIAAVVAKLRDAPGVGDNLEDFTLETTDGLFHCKSVLARNQYGQPVFVVTVKTFVGHKQQ